MGSVTEDWEVTSGQAPSEEASEDNALEQQRGISILSTSAGFTDAIEVQPDRSGELEGSIPRGNNAAAAAAAADAPTEDSDIDPAVSVATSVLNGFLETGRRQEVQQQSPWQEVQQQSHQQHQEGLARAKFWDKQIANGHLSMLPEIDTLHVNIMAWGESGLGKTTCIKNLVQGWDLKFMGEAFEAGGPTSPEQFKRDPASMRLETQPIIDRGANKALILTIQDMPGWGDDVDLLSNLRTVVQFLLEQRRKDLLNNKAGTTECHPCPGAVMKHGMTVCLYFLPPQRAKAMDWYMLEGISRLVAVVPVIAKADTHTAPELEAYRKEVQQVIQQAGSQAATTNSQASHSASSCSSGAAAVTSSPLTHSFDCCDLEAVSAKDPLMQLFAVMGSQVVLTPEDGPLGASSLPCRPYLWGTAFPLDREHSDLVILKQLLTGHQNRAVYGLLNDSWTRAHRFYQCYEQLKKAQLEAKVASGQLPSNLAAILSAVEGLEVDLDPLVGEVCGGISRFGGGQQPLQDRLRCEEQQRLEHKLQQALQQLELRHGCGVQRWQLTVAVVLAFVLGLLLALLMARVYLQLGGDGGGLQGACAAGAPSNSSSMGPGSTSSAGAGEAGHQAAPPPFAAHDGPHPRELHYECFKKLVWRHGVQEWVRVCNPLGRS